MFAFVYPNLLRLIAIALACGLPFTAHAQDDNRGHAILVFDASGSMWGQIGEDHKVEIARTAVADMLLDWDTKTDLGLIAYGHNRTGDCNDIEMLLAPQPLDSGLYTQTVNALNPRGKTPLTDAVIMAANALDFTEERATVILLTDGLETCERDPCATGLMLEERGIDFTTHVIGFGVADGDAASLYCLSENTGGLYLRADDMDELSAALQEISSVTTEPAPIEEAVIEPIPEPEFDLSPATLVVPDSVIVRYTFIVEWTGPANPGDRIDVRSIDGSSIVSGQPVAQSVDGNTVELLAPPEVGTYTVEYVVADDIPPLGTAILNVVTVGPSLTIPETVQFGGDFEVFWTGPGSNGDRIFVVDPATGDDYSTDQARVRDKGVGELRAPEIIGTFEVQLVAGSTGEVLASAPFRTTPVTGSIIMPEGPFHVGDRGMPVQWTGPRNGADRLRVFARGSEDSISQRPASRNSPETTNVSVPSDAGLYTLKLISRAGNVYAEADFEVLPEQ